MSTVVTVSPALLQRASTSSFTNHRTLLLNADYQPMGWPLETLSGEATLHGLCLGRFKSVEMSDTYAHSPTTTLRLPSVVALRDYVDPKAFFGVPNVSLYNLFIRDRGICQYTGRPLRMGSKHRSEEATKDHVVPRVDAGSDSWDNVVLASSDINSRKGRKHLDAFDHRLLTRPWEPRGYDLLYLWMTDDKLADMPTAWQAFLEPIRNRPSPRVLRVLEYMAA
jgi:5-methylcytosine-specific restriction endonuclease McrA